MPVGAVDSVEGINSVQPFGLKASAFLAREESIRGIEIFDKSCEVVKSWIQYWLIST